MGLVDELRAAQLPPPPVRRARREAAGASLRDFGRELGVSAMTVFRWERGDATPRRDRAVAYRQLLDELGEVA